MTAVIETLKSYLNVLNALPKDEQMYVSSFSIGKWLTNGPAFETLRLLNNRKANLLVGVPKYRSCIPTYGQTEGMCKHCLKSHHNSLKRIAKMRETWKNINWVFVRQIHSKMVLCGEYCIIGSRNITDGKSKEVGIVIQDKNLSDKLRKIWHKYAEESYHIGTNGPLVFIKPLFGEIMADSPDFTEEMKSEIIESGINNAATRYWQKEEWFTLADIPDNDAPF